MPRPEPGPGEVRLRVRAVSLNYRDLMVARGQYAVTADRPLIPCSDAAGEVLAVGDAVTRFKPGDAVIGAFFRDWIDGDVSIEKTEASLGGGVDGTLVEEMVAPEHALVHMPEHLDFVEAATLPCTWVTAWNALYVAAGLKPGASVLLLGTGGVSVAALQLAQASGLSAIVTSGSDEKLKRALALGAEGTINYRSVAEWQDEVLKQTGGRGVDLVVEVGGEGTLARSVASTRAGGTIAVIGGLSGFGSALQPIDLIWGGKRAHGIFVGSRVMLEDVCRFVQRTRLKPVVDRVFGFDSAREAYQQLSSAQHFGKLAIRLDS